MVPVQSNSKGATKDLRVLNFVVPARVLKSNFFDNRHVLVPVAAAVTTKHHENVAVISSNNNLLYFTPNGSQPYTNNPATCSVLY